MARIVQEAKHMSQCTHRRLYGERQLNLPCPWPGCPQGTNEDRVQGEVPMSRHGRVRVFERDHHEGPFGGGEHYVWKWVATLDPSEVRAQQFAADKIAKQRSEIDRLRKQRAVESAEARISVTQAANAIHDERTKREQVEVVLAARDEELRCARARADGQAEVIKRLQNEAQHLHSKIATQKQENQDLREELRKRQEALDRYAPSAQANIAEALDRRALEVAQLRDEKRAADEANKRLIKMHDRAIARQRALESELHNVRGAKMHEEIDRLLRIERITGAALHRIKTDGYGPAVAWADCAYTKCWPAKKPEDLAEWCKKHFDTEAPAWVTASYSDLEQRVASCFVPRSHLSTPWSLSDMAERWRKAWPEHAHLFEERAKKTSGLLEQVVADSRTTLHKKIGELQQEVAQQRLAKKSAEGQAESFLQRALKAEGRLTAEVPAWVTLGRLTGWSRHRKPYTAETKYAVHVDGVQLDVTKEVVDAAERAWERRDAGHLNTLVEVRFK